MEQPDFVYVCSGDGLAVALLAARFAAKAVIHRSSQDQSLSQPSSGFAVWVGGGREPWSLASGPMGFVWPVAPQSLDLSPFVMRHRCATDAPMCGVGGLCAGQAAGLEARLARPWLQQQQGQQQQQLQLQLQRSRRKSNSISLQFLIGFAVRRHKAI